MFVVPTIDLSPYLDGDPAVRPRTAIALDRACGTVGFVQLSGHGVRPRSLAGLTDALDAFFALPTEQKRELIVADGTNRGYSPPRSESLSRSLGVEQPGNANDYFEAFNVGTAADGPASGGDGNVWPDLPGFREAVETWVREARRVVRALATALGDALGDREALHRLADDPVQVLRLNHYALDEQDLPDGSDPADVSGMGEHTDYGLVTLLWADRVPGLQVLHEGTWHDVVPDEGTLLMNVGDLTARLTGDRWRSTLHRVRPPVRDGRVLRRRSAAFFHDGDPDARVETLPLPGAMPYSATTVREHLARKLAGSRGGAVNPTADREAARVREAAR